MREISAQKAYKSLESSLIKAENALSHMEERREVVFLPYKASMWDSLESVWKAADEDPNCDAYVVPIPYYDRNSDGSYKKIIFYNTSINGLLHASRPVGNSFLKEDDKKFIKIRLCGQKHGNPRKYLLDNKRRFFYNYYEKI